MDGGRGRLLRPPRRVCRRHGLDASGAPVDAGRGNSARHGARRVVGAARVRARPAPCAAHPGRHPVRALAPAAHRAPDVQLGGGQLLGVHGRLQPCRGPAGRRRPAQLRVAPARRPHARDRRPGAARRRGVRYGGVAPQRSVPARDTHPLCRPDLRPHAHPSARARRAVPRRAGSDRVRRDHVDGARRRARSGRGRSAATACGPSSRGLSTT